VKQDTGDSLQLACIYRKNKTSFGWVYINFEDAKGKCCGGLRYAPIKALEAPDKLPPQSLAEIQSISKMAAIAIPLSFVVGPDESIADKYCCITNWWKERNQQGHYVLPELDASYYIRDEAFNRAIDENEAGSGQNVGVV